MKVSNSNSQPLQPADLSVKKAAQSQAVADNKEATPEVGSSQNTSQVRIQSWFARAGIKAGSMSDPRERENNIQRRRVINATQRYQNLQSIMDIAMSVSVADSNNEHIDIDWFHSFIELAESVYSPTMQELWGKIFALEAGKPGSFSLRTLETLKALTQKDARIFSRAASLAGRCNGEQVPRILVGYYRKRGLMTLLQGSTSKQLNLANYGLSYPDLLSLIDMKLIYASEIETGELNPNRRNVWKFGGANLNIAARKGGMALAYYKFTSIGAELYSLSAKSTPNDYIEGLKALLNASFEVSG